MQEITIYTTPVCPYCVRAKDLLMRKGRSDYREIDITQHQDYMKEMLEKSGGRRTVPQIFIGNTHVGGCDDLYALDSAGKLDALLK
ncbi:MAG TPA: glutaredoxin 3 [Rickettsiales bacterium]|nr:glutaredoxin 3 [Rickettsiales bacterium]